MVQAHIFFTGMVQGVGFRYTTHQMATALKLKGWVKNLPDGRVEVLAEGEKSAIEDLCKNLEGHFGSYIRQKTINYYEHQNQFKDFQVT
jgi:acylphosphatase